MTVASGPADSVGMRLLMAHMSVIHATVADLGPAGVRAAHSAVIELAKAVAVRRFDDTEPLLAPPLARAAKASPIDISPIRGSLPPHRPARSARPPQSATPAGEDRQSPDWPTPILTLTGRGAGSVCRRPGSPTRSGDECTRPC